MKKKQCYIRIDQSPGNASSGVFECGSDNRVNGITGAVITLGLSGKPQIRIDRISESDTSEQFEIMSVEITGSCETEVVITELPDMWLTPNRPPASDDPHSRI